MDNLKSLMEKINKHHDEFIQDRILSKWKKSAEFEFVRIFGTSVLTPDSVRAIYSYKRLYVTYDHCNLTFLSPMAGGVTIAPELSEKCFQSDTTGFVADLRNVAINSRPTNKSVYWFFDIPVSLYNRILGWG